MSSKMSTPLIDIQGGSQGWMVYNTCLLHWSPPDIIHTKSWGGSMALS